MRNCPRCGFDACMAFWNRVWLVLDKAEVAHISGGQVSKCVLVDLLCWVCGLEQDAPPVGAEDGLPHLQDWRACRSWFIVRCVVAFAVSVGGLGEGSRRGKGWRRGSISRFCVMFVCVGLVWCCEASPAKRARAEDQVRYCLVVVCCLLALFQ